MTGYQLQQARKSLSQTQKGLAMILGVSPNTVARWEREVLAMPTWVALAMKGLGAKIPRNSSKRADRGVKG